MKLITEKQMSNALARKKKRMQPLGYSKSELIGIQRHAKAQSNADYLIEESYYNVRMMAYQALHDKFGFGHKRIIKVEQTIDAYVENAKDGTTGEELGFYLKDKCKIDVRKETNKIPYRESFYLVERNIAPNCMIQANKFLLAQVFNYFAMLGVCLKTQFKYLINCLATGYETMTGIASVLEWECKYIDKRFIGKTYEI